MSVVQYDPRLLGATDAAFWPSLAGTDIVAIIAVSPRTGHVLLLELGTSQAAAHSLALGLLAPRKVVVNTDRDEAWIFCDDGTLVRVAASRVGGRLELAELGRQSVAAPDRARWLLLGRGLAATSGLVASGRAPIPGAGLGAGAPHADETLTDTRTADLRSSPLVILPSARGEIALFRADLEGIHEVGRQAIALPDGEAAAFHPYAGCFYVVDSNGLGSVVTVDVDNGLDVVLSFALPKVQGPITAKVGGGMLLVLCERRNRLLGWNLDDPYTPVSVLDTTLDNGLYWERNPVRDIQADPKVLMLMQGGILQLNQFGGLLLATAEIAALRKFGSLPDVMTVGDLPLTKYGRMASRPGIDTVRWVLNGDIGAITHTYAGP